MSLKKSGDLPTTPDDDGVKNAINSFNKQISEALEHFTDVAWLGNHSPLAAPYFLGAHLASTIDSQSSAVRGSVLQQVLLEAASSLADLSDEQRLKKAQLKAQVDRSNGQYQSLYFDHLTECIRMGNKAQRMIYWSYVHQPRFAKVDPILDEDRLNMPRTTYYRTLPKVIQQLTQALIRQTKPALRLEQPAPAAQLFGRTTVAAACLDALRAGCTVALSGAGGVGKTALGAHLLARLGDQPAFWFTLRPGLNDNLSSLLFRLSYFLHQQGAGISWLQLVADNGQVNSNIVQGLILDDLRHLPQVPVVCIDEIDLLRPSEVNFHDQICAFLMQLRDEKLPLLLIGQRLPPQLNVDFPQLLPALEQSAFSEVLEQAEVYLEPHDIGRLHTYTHGNPRLLDLFISLYRSGEALEQGLERMASIPALDVLLLRVVEKLKPVEQRMLRQLAVFRRPAPADGWGAPGEQQALDQLVVLHLVQRDHQGGVTLLPAFRATLYNQLSPEKRETFHLQAAVMRAKRGEHTAASYHYLQGGQPRLSLWTWYLHRDDEKKGGQAEVALGILRQISGNQLAEDDRAVLILARSELELLIGGYDQTRESLVAVDAATDDAFTALTERMRGHVATMQNEFDEAIKSYRAGLLTVERLISERAMFRKNLSWVEMRQKRLNEAWQEACLSRYEAENLQGYIQMELSNYAAAQQYYESALKLAQDAGFLHGIAKTSDNLGRLLAMRGSFTLAQKHAAEARQLFESIGDKVNAMGVVINQAMAFNLASQHQAALEYAQATIVWFEQIGEPWGQATAAQNLAEAHLALGQLEIAQHYAQRVLDVGKQEQGTLPDGLRVMGEIKLAQGDLQEAENYICQSIALAEQNQDRYLEAYGWRSLNSVYASQERVADSQRAHDTAVKLFAELALPHEIERMGRMLTGQGFRAATSLKAAR